VVLTEDPALANAVGGRRLALDARSGELLPAGGLVDRLKRAFGGAGRSRA
jgi:hypothetical protein